jgi:branched-chain amino acid transport system ATP-binding protein
MRQSRAATSAPLAVSPPASPELLSVSHLSVQFGGIRALLDLSLDVRPGEVVVIIGPNGAGKSTTLNAISGLVPCRGEVLVNGQSTRKCSPSQLAAVGVGRSFQDPQLIDRSTVLDNVLCGAHASLGYAPWQQVLLPLSVARRERQATEFAMHLLDKVRLATYMHAKVHDLSYGARKLVDIVRALASRPSVLLLDEPTSGLDRDKSAELEELIVSLSRESDIAILVVEHHMDMVRRVATRVVALQAGEVLMTGTPTEVLDSAELQASFVGSSAQRPTVGGA